MSKRLGGGGIKVEGPPLERYRCKLTGMAEAVEKYRLGVAKYPGARKRALIQQQLLPLAVREMLGGDVRLPAVLASADRLIDEALACDPRLVRKSSWLRGEEGLDGCAALIASGDDRPFFDRRKQKLSEAATVEPMRIVISTDSKEVTPDHAVAFIAAAKIAQQFRPLEIWWQGAWLREAGRPQEGCGHVFHVPLVIGDLDFARLQFVLSSKLRDHASFFIMLNHAYPTVGWGGGVGEVSYLDGTDHYVRESGIRCDPTSVARTAAYWAGFEPLWNDEINPAEALQYWRPDAPPTPMQTETEKERRDRVRRWEEQDRARQKAEQEIARQRVQSIT